jgi:hypothetical protein
LLEEIWAVKLQPDSWGDGGRKPKIQLPRAEGIPSSMVEEIVHQAKWLFGEGQVFADKRERL